MEQERDAKNLVDWKVFVRHIADQEVRRYSCRVGYQETGAKLHGCSAEVQSGNGFIVSQSDHRKPMSAAQYCQNKGRVHSTIHTGS